MISQVHKTVKGKTPYSLIDPETEARGLCKRYFHLPASISSLQESIFSKDSWKG